MTGTRTPAPAALGAALRAFVALAVLLAPLFAHGCHSGDEDHEPFVAPQKLNREHP